MKKKLQIISGLLILLAISILTLLKSDSKEEIAKTREIHKNFLENSPFKKTLKLSKKERKNLGIPPNKYYEREWELTMNPEIGRPQPENIIALQKEIQNDNSAYRVPGDGVDNLWIERGPNNVGGRTRVVFFDPTDATNSRVFAGGVSGGLWKTEDISTNGGWSLVTSLPTNLSITCFAIDPNDNNTWYLGSGEQSTYGSAVGRGVYKTTDAGVTWNQVLDVYSFDTDSGNVFGGIHFINDIVAWDNNGSTEIYVGAAAGFDGETSPTNFLGAFERGLYQSTNGGTNWTKDPNVVNVSVNDLEVDADGNLWLATTNSYGFGDSGGAIYKRDLGASTTFSLVTTISGVNRTEIEASATNPDKFYVLAEGATPVMYVTNDAFATAPTSITLPNDPDGSVPANDFTRGQAFFDFVLEADPTNDNIVYVGGINVHRSANSGTNWNTISHWAPFFSTNGSLVHADQHALTFHPTNSNLGVLGHDGGISYVSNFSATGNNLNVIIDVDDTYNVTQFYYGDIAPGSFNSGDYMIAGAQDNGTQLIEDGNTSGPDSAFRIFGGDGASSFYDQVATDYLIGNYVYNNAIRLYDYSDGEYKIVAENNNDEGDFINQAGLDSNLDMLFTNGSTSTNNRIYIYEGLTSLPTITRDGAGNLTSAQATRNTLTNALLTGKPTAFTISPYTTASTTMLVGTEDSKVLLLTNANTTPTWTDISGGSFLGSISDVQFGSSEQHIFVTMHNYGVTNVWYTDDQGTTWDAIEGNLPDMPVKCILQNPMLPNELIIGTAFGIWRTDDFGPDLSTSPADPTWSLSVNGMSDVPVLDLDLRTSDNTVLATTHGRGLFTGKFTNSGLSVSEFSEKYGLKVFPTVTDGIVNIKTLSNVENMSLDVYDINGRAHVSKDLNLDFYNQEEIDLSNLSSGIYFMNFKIDNATETIKIVKK